MTTALTSITETQVFAALRAVLNGLSLLSSAPGVAVPVVRGQANRVPQPSAADHVVMWPIRRERMSTNVDTWSDVTAFGYVYQNTLHAASVVNGTLLPGLPAYGAGLTTGVSVRSQTSGVAPGASTDDAGNVVTDDQDNQLPSAPVQTGQTSGGAGVYALTPTASVGVLTDDAGNVLTDDAGNVLTADPVPVYVGSAAALQPTEFVIQLDVHGPCSGDNAFVISTALRDYVGVDAFAAVAAGVVPLYADDPRQLAFVDAESQYEEKWSVDVHLQVDAVVTFTQQFAAKLAVKAIAVEPTYSP